MKRKMLITLFSSILILIGTLTFSAPGLISYQGRLTNAGGTPITSEVNVTFTFWDAETDGNQLGSGFSDTDAVTPDSNGVYSSLIGDDPDNLVPLSVFSGDTVYLNVNVAGEDLLPRKRFNSVGYAMKASRADHATNAQGVTKTMKDFVVRSGESITAGDVVGMLENGQIMKGTCQYTAASTFNKGGTRRVKAVSLTKSLFVVAYCDEGNSYYGTAVVGQASGGTLSWGATSVFNSAMTTSIDITALSDTKFVVCYRDYGSSSKGIVRIGSVSGTKINWGAESVFNNASSPDNSIASITSTKFVVVYEDMGNSGYGTGSLGSVQDLSVKSWDSESVFRNDNTDMINVAALSEKKIVVAFREGGGSGRAKWFLETLIP